MPILGLEFGSISQENQELPKLLEMYPYYSRVTFRRDALAAFITRQMLNISLPGNHQTTPCRLR